MRYWLALAACLLAAPVLADMYQDGSNAKRPDARYNIGSNNACNPVSDYNADPTGAASTTAAINQCAATTKNGQRTNIYLPAGTYKVTGQINLSAGQCLYGDGKGTTTIAVGADFAPAATGVISLSGREQQGPCVRDLTISFAQPTDQTARANFAALGSCTAGAGGTGCRYPPAIYLADTNRFRISDILISGAWDGIKNAPGNNLGGMWIDNIEVGALNVGLAIGDSGDFCHIKGFHFWPFGLNIGATYTSVYQDGGTYAAKIGRCDSVQAADISTFQGRIEITPQFTMGKITNLALDGNNATLEINGNDFLQLDSVYATGVATGANTNSQINIGGGRVNITNLYGSATGSGDTGTALRITGGSVTLSGGQIVSNGPTARAIKITGGGLVAGNMFFLANTGAGAYTVPLVDVTGGQIGFTGNTFQITAGSNVGGVSVTTDSSGNNISGNTFNGWGLVLPTSITAGEYGPNNVASFQIPSPTVNFGVNGTFAPTYTSRGGSYRFMGNGVIQYDLLVQFNTNAYTGASGAFEIAPTIPLLPLTETPMNISSMANVSFTSASLMSVALQPYGRALLRVFNPGGALGNMGTAEIPPSATGVLIAGSGQFRYK